MTCIAREDWCSVATLEYLAGICRVEHGSCRCICLFHYGQKGNYGRSKQPKSERSGQCDRRDGHGLPSPHKPTSRRKPLVGAYVALVLFMVIYCARPEDWIPGLSNVPLAKIAGILGITRLGLFPSAHPPPLPSGNHLPIPTDRAIVPCIATISSVAGRGVSDDSRLRKDSNHCRRNDCRGKYNQERLRLLIFTQAASVALIAAVTVLKGACARRAIGRDARWKLFQSQRLSALQSLSHSLCASRCCSLPGIRFGKLLGHWPC